MFKPVGNSQTSISDRIVEQIKEMIFSGELKAGDKLPSENELCNMFGVSRTSIREGVKILSGLGFLSIRRGLGIFVEELDAGYLINQLGPIIVQKEDDLLDIVRVRKLLETHAAAWAAENASAKDIENMEKAIQKSVDLIQNDKANNTNLAETNLLFHMVLTKSTGSKVLCRIMESLLDLLSEARKITVQLPGRYKHSVEGHKRILEAIKDRDPSKAEEAMMAHLRGIEAVVSDPSYSLQQTEGKGDKNEDSDNKE